MSSTFQQIKQELEQKKVELVAVSKTRSVDTIMNVYNQGQRIFGENRAQEMQAKAAELPSDIQWHFIGHLQTKKVKYIINDVHLIHSIDRVKLLEEVNKRAHAIDRVVDVLFQFYIATEEAKYGFNRDEIIDILQSNVLDEFQHVRLVGLMAMATFTGNEDQIRREFNQCSTLFQEIKTTYYPSNDDFHILSMGMSNDYKIAVEEGANMVRIGSLLFGARNI